MSDDTRSLTGLKTWLRDLYEGDSGRAHRFRYGLLVFDLTTITFVIATSFTDHGTWVQSFDTVVGLLLLIEFCARWLIAPRRMKFLVSPFVLADLVAVLSFLAPLAGEGLGFLRVLRTLRLLRTYELLHRLRRDFSVFRRNEDVIVATINLVVFIFVMTGLVYSTQFKINPQIGNYGDALYFTVTALTTTGFGDITLQGSLGRIISVVVMVCGVTLFLRLAQVLFRPRKVRQPCHVCGLALHDSDAVHCKHCGEVIRIETEGME